MASVAIIDCCEVANNGIDPDGGTTVVSIILRRECLYSKTGDVRLSENYDTY